jgi:3-hydroxybutyryl-CoA dehydratase
MSTAATEVRWDAPFEELAVGQTFSTPTRVVTDEDVQAFARLTGDHHPQHTDAAWSAGSVFGQQIAHGLLVISVAGGLVPFDPRRVMALRKVADATFKRPVLFGDELHVEGRLAEASEVSEEAGLVTFAWNVVNQDGRAVCRARVEVLWRRGPLPG